MTHSPVRLMAVLAVTGIAVSGCENIGNPFEAIAKKKPAPDEFQVLARKPLQMPGSGVSSLRAPGTTLPTPEPGAISPLEPTPKADAMAALGADPRPSTSVSRGEVALLQAADAASASSEIRTQLAQENADREANAPYEAKPIWEVLGVTGDSGPYVDPAIVIDPVEESQRLQTAGLSAPSDPNAKPLEEPEERVSSGTQLFYPTPDGRAPRNTFTNTNTRPEVDEVQTSTFGIGSEDKKPAE